MYGLFFISSLAEYEDLFSNSQTFTVMRLSIGTPINNKFSICPKWKINYMYIWCPEIKNLYSLVRMFLNVGTPKNH